MKKKTIIVTLEQFKEQNYGKRDTAKLEALELGYQDFKLGAMIQEARKIKCLTQEELAEKTGTTKSLISRMENDVKEVRHSTLQKIVKIGLGGKMNLCIEV